MTKLERLISRTHAVDPNTLIMWAIEPSGLRVPVYRVTPIDIDYTSLIISAPLLLRAVDVALPMLDTLGRILEAHDMEAHCVPIMQLEAGLNVARKAAIFEK